MTLSCWWSTSWEEQSNILNTRTTRKQRRDINTPEILNRLVLFKWFESSYRKKNKNQMKMKECWMWNKHLALHSCCPHFQVEEHYKLETKDYLTTIKRLQVEPCEKNTANKRKQNYKLSPGGKSKVVIITDSSNRTWLGSFRRWVVHRDRPGPQAPGLLF